MAQDRKTDRLATIPLFAGSDSKHLARIAELCTEVRLAEGSVLCREGEPGREFLVLEQGSASVATGGEEVATLGAGDWFGELSLLDGQPRNATVTATSDVVVLVLARNEFSALLQEEPAIAVRLLPAITARLRRAGSERPTD